MHSRDRRYREVATIFESLSRDGSDRLELTAFLETEALRLERHDYLELLRDVNQRIREHITNGSFLVAVRAVAQRIEVECLKEETSRTTELVGFLIAVVDRVALLEESIRERVLSIAVDSFGRLVKSGGAIAGAKTGRHIEDMLQLMDENDVLSSTVALRLLSELAQNAPTRFGVYTEKFMTKAYPLLFHESASLRHDALEALKGCLGVAAQRATGKRQGWFQDLAQNLISAATGPGTAKVARGLVALRVVILESSGNLLSLFPTLSESVMSLMSHSEPIVQTEVIQLIPVLAQLCPENFTQTLWKPSIDHYISYLRNKMHESEVLEAVVKLVRVLVSVEAIDMMEMIEAIGEALVEILSDVASSAPTCQSAIKCIGAFAELLQDAWKEISLGLLPQLLQETVDSVLLISVHQISQAYPEAVPTIQSSLLQHLTETNWDQPEVLTVVYQILETFQLELPSALLPPLAASLGSSLSDVSPPELKSSAAGACLSLLSFYAIHPAEHSTGDDIDAICDHLTTAAVLDPSSQFRLELLTEMCRREQLHERLAQDATIRRLAKALYDPSLAIQLRGVELMGHLSVHNFAAVLPLLRELLLNLMSNFHFQGDVAITASILGHSAQLLRALLKAQSKVAEAFLPQLTEALLDRLERYIASKAPCRTVKDPTSETVLQFMHCLMELIRCSPPSAIRMNISRLALILTQLTEISSGRERQMLALQTVVQICDVTGDALLNRMNPNALKNRLKALRAKTSVPEEIQALEQIRQGLSQWHSEFQSAASPSNAAPEIAEKRGSREMPPYPTEETTVGDETYYSNVTIQAAVAVLEDTRQTDYEGILKCLMSIFERLKKSGVVYLQRVIPVLCKIVREADEKLRLVLFQHLSGIVRIAGGEMQPYCDAVMHLCFDYWSESSAQSIHILNLMAELARAVQASFATFLRELIPRLGAILSTPAEVELVEPALGLLQASGSQLAGFLPVLFPILTQFLQKVPSYAEPIALNVQREVLKTLRQILQSVAFREEEKYLMASKLFLTLIGLLRQEESLRADTEDTLAVVISVLGPSISQVFAHQIRNALGDETSHVLQLGLERLSDPDFNEASVYTPAEIESLNRTSIHSPSASQTSQEVSQLDIVELAKAWDTSERSTREDWEEWMRHLSLEFLRQSPSPALRACHSLAQIKASVAKALFKDSLLSVWSKLDEIYRHQLQDALETVLMTPAMPLDVVQPIIALGDYLNFIEQQEMAVASDLTSLDALAQKCSSYSSVLHYRMRSI